MTEPLKPLVGGVIHTYQKFDPRNFPSPTAPPPDTVSPALEHMLRYGSMRQLTEEELARAIRLDPSQIAGLGPSLDMLRDLLEERKRKILEKYETETVQKTAQSAWEQARDRAGVPKEFRGKFDSAAASGQYRDLERLWYQADRVHKPFARTLLSLMERLGESYQVDELASKYAFTGRESMTVPKALRIKEELEKIDELLKQLDEAAKTAQIALIDTDALREFVEEADIDQLRALQKQVEETIRDAAKQQGLESQGQGKGYQLTPQAMRLFQGRLLERLFAKLDASRTGRHQNAIVGDGAVELQATRPYQFGDSVTQMDIPQSFVNALLRDKTQRPIRLTSDDIVIHKTRNTPKAATAVIMDMSGSMRYDGQYVHVKRMALALDGLIRKEYPGDHVSFFEMFSFAKLVRPGEIVELMPKPVTIHDPVVRLRADMSNEEMSEHLIPPHFTNIQHGLSLARRMLSVQDTPNRQIVLITDGLPTAHFEDQHLYLLYPPDPLTEEATMREARLCAREGITINLFLIPSWSQSEEDVRFAYRVAESTRGRVFFTAGRDLDRFVLWDYLERKREILS